METTAGEHNFLYFCPASFIKLWFCMFELTAQSYFITMAFSAHSSSVSELISGCLNHYLYESKCTTTYLLTYAPNADSNQSAHPRSLIRVFVVRTQKLCILGYPKRRPVKDLIRLRECAGWSESSLGAHVCTYVFWRCGSYKERRQATLKKLLQPKIR